MYRRLDATLSGLDLLKQALEAKDAALKEKVYQYGRWDLELNAAQAAIGRGKVSSMI